MNDIIKLVCNDKAIIDSNNRDYSVKECISIIANKNNIPILEKVKYMIGLLAKTDSEEDKVLLLDVIHYYQKIIKYTRSSLRRDHVAVASIIGGGINSFVGCFSSVSNAISSAKKEIDSVDMKNVFIRIKIIKINSIETCMTPYYTFDRSGNLMWFSTPRVKINDAVQEAIDYFVDLKCPFKSGDYVEYNGKLAVIYNPDVDVASSANCFSDCFYMIITTNEYGELIHDHVNILNLHTYTNEVSENNIFYSISKSLKENNINWDSIYDLFGTIIGI